MKEKFGVNDTRRITRRTILACLTLLSLVSSVQAQTQRTRSPKVWRLLWNTGGTIDDHTFGWIREHVATDDAIYILDAGALQVHALDLMNGRVRWSVGRRGSGPGEFRAPVDIALTRAGFAVLDPGNGRISLFSKSGSHISDVVNPKLSNGRALCTMADGSSVINLGRNEHFLVRINAKGQEIGSWSFPWPRVDITNPLLTSVNTIRGAPDHECFFATTFGFGVIRIDDNNRLRSTPFVETYPTPEFRERLGSSGLPGIYLESGTNASTGGARWQDTLAIQATNAAGNPVGYDLYDRKTGAYLTTFGLPGAERFAIHRGILVTLAASGITPRVRAWADTADTVRVFKEMQRAARTRSTARSTPPSRASTPARPPAPAPARPPAIP